MVQRVQFSCNNLRVMLSRRSKFDSAILLIVNINQVLFSRNKLKNKRPFDKQIPTQLTRIRGQNFIWVMVGQPEPDPYLKILKFLIKNMEKNVGYAG